MLWIEALRRVLKGERRQQLKTLSEEVSAEARKLRQRLREPDALDSLIESTQKAKRQRNGRAR